MVILYYLYTYKSIYKLYKVVQVYLCNFILVQYKFICYNKINEYRPKETLAVASAPCTLIKRALGGEAYGLHRNAIISDFYNRFCRTREEHKEITAPVW